MSDTTNELLELEVMRAKVKRWQEIANQRAIEVADLQLTINKVERENTELRAVANVPKGMWYFTFYCEDYDSVQKIRVLADAPRRFTCGVTGISKKG